MGSSPIRSTPCLVAQLVQSVGFTHQRSWVRFPPKQLISNEYASVGELANPPDLESGASAVQVRLLPEVLNYPLTKIPVERGRSDNERMLLLPDASLERAEVGSIPT